MLHESDQRPVARRDPIADRGPEPPGRVSLRLHIDAGSLHESEDQRGVAHFLEQQTHAAIADSLAVPRSTVTAHIREGVELLRRKLRAR